MTPPVQPQRAFDRQSVQDWIDVLHTASAVPQDAPDYAEARSVVQQALEQIGHLNRTANAADRNAAEKGPTSLLASTVVPALHGASFGIGEPIAGAASALTGGTFREGAAGYREGLDRLEASHPTAAATSELAGMFAPAAVPMRAAGGVVQAGRAIGIKSALTRVAQGAGTGAAIGGVSGFSSGGEDPGDFDQRFDAAQEGALVGGALGGVLTGGGLKLRRLHAERAADLEAKGSERRAAGLREELLRKRLDRYDAPEATPLPGVIEAQPGPSLAPQAAHPDIVRAVRDYEAGRISGTDLRTAMDVARGRSAAPPSPPPIVSSATRPVIEAGAPQGPPSPPRTKTLDWGEPTPEQLELRRGGADPSKSYQELYGDVVAPPQSRPNMLAEDQPIRVKRTAPLDVRAIADKTGAKIAAPGPYQRAAPAARMESGPQNTDFANKLADNPELLEPHLKLLQMLGQEPNPSMTRQIVRRLRGFTPEDQ